MNSATRRTGARVRMLVAALLIGAASLASSSPPASAHGNENGTAVRDGCEYNFEWDRDEWRDYKYIPHTWRSIYIEGQYAGGVILARSPGRDLYCVVTYKISSYDKHEEPTWMEAHIWRDGTGRVEDEGNFSHWAAVPDYPSRGDCLNYAGYIKNAKSGWPGEGTRRIARYCP